MAAVDVASCHHHGMIKQAKSLHEVSPRWFAAFHVVREGVHHLKNLTFIRGSAEHFKQVEEGQVDLHSCCPS